MIKGNEIQRDNHAAWRTGVAVLLAPTMLEGVQLSWEEAQKQQLTESADRYDLLLNTTTMLIQAPHIQARSMERYQRDKRLRAMFSDEDDLQIFLEHGAEALINPVVIDGQWAAMSAEGFVMQTSSLSPAEVVPRSVGLLAITGVEDAAMFMLYEELGLPIASEYFGWEDATTHSLPTLTFTDAARTIMDKYPSPMHDDCPAYSLPDPSGRLPSLLHAYWDMSTTYALSDLATDMQFPSYNEV